MSTITNNNGISLPLAVWLVHDEYDYVNEENYISATGLMKPLRQIVLRSRVPPSQRKQEDVVDFISRGLGHTIHDGVEKAWKKGYRVNLAKLGYPESVIDRVLINPTKEELKPDSIPVYIEQREKRTIVVNGVCYTIGGKFDMVTEGIVNDAKSTSAFTWKFGGKDDDYKLQGSLYRWLNPEKITEDFIRVNFIFTDWQKAMVRTEGYPQKRIESKDIPLMSVDETENWIRNKLSLVQRYKDAPEEEIPECTDEELWRSDPQYKYFSDPLKTDGRSTRNFDSLADARKFMAEKGGKGVIITKPGEVKRCAYCDVFDVCTQKDRYTHD